MGKVHVSYELVAGGTALLERESGEKMPVMLTLFHVDGDRLLLTHYCMAGNQPRMQAKRFDAAAGEIEFQFLDGTNLTPGAGHMHNARFRLVDDQHFQSEWQFYENGKLKFRREPSIHTSTIGDDDGTIHALTLRQSDRLGEPQPRGNAEGGGEVLRLDAEAVSRRTASGWPRTPAA